MRALNSESMANQLTFARVEIAGQRGGFVADVIAILEVLSARLYVTEQSFAFTHTKSRGMLMICQLTNSFDEGFYSPVQHPRRIRVYLLGWQ